MKTAPEVLAAAPGRLKRLVADRGYDANNLRRDLKADGTTPIIPGRRSRKRPIQHDQRRYRERWRIEAAFCRLKDFRRVATRGACPRAGEAGPGGQARSQLRLGRCPRRRHRILVLIESGT